MIRKEKRPKNNSEPDYLVKEMDIPQNLDHPCITKVLEVQSEKQFVIVMELAPGGELFDHVSPQWFFLSDKIPCLQGITNETKVCCERSEQALRRR